MPRQVRSLKDLSDSKILYDRQLPAFGYMIVVLVSALLIGILIWSLVTPKVYIVKGSGMIESTNKNYIMSAYSGAISQIKIKNGDYAEKGDLLFSIQSTDLNLQQIQIDGKIELYEKQISQFQKLQQSIQDNINYFDQNNADDLQYYNQFETYNAQIAQNAIDITTYQQYGYTDTQIQAEIKKNEGKISEIYHATLKSVEESISNAKAERDNLKIQGDAVSAGQSDYKITANTSGIIHMSTDYKEGMVIQAGTPVGSIADENDSYIVKAYINVEDMPRVNIGDSVDIVVSGLLQSVYGTIPGTLIKIDSDITSSQGSTDQDQTKSNGTSYFRLDIQADANYLVSKSGRKYNLSNGTAVETRIKYDEVTYFKYFLQLLGVLVR